MNRSCYLTLGFCLAGLALKAGAQQSAPAAAPADPGAAPADTMSAHDSHMMNLRESGYNPKDDLTSAGNVKAN